MRKERKMIDRRSWNWLTGSHLKESNPKKALKISNRRKKSIRSAKKDVYILVIPELLLLEIAKAGARRSNRQKAISLAAVPFAFKFWSKLVISGNFNQAEEFIAKARKPRMPVTIKISWRICIWSKAICLPRTAAREAVRLKDNSPAIGILGEVLRKQKKYARSAGWIGKNKNRGKNVSWLFVPSLLPDAFAISLPKRKSNFRLAEKSLAQDNFGYFDSRSANRRLHIFIQETLIAGETVGDELLARVKKAAHWLKEKRKDSDIGKFQRSDMLSALRAAQFYNL